MLTSLVATCLYSGHLRDSWYKLVLGGSYVDLGDH